MREYDWCKKIAGEFLCPSNDGVPQTNYEKRTVKYLARFACYVLRKFREEKGVSDDS